MQQYTFTNTGTFWTWDASNPVLEYNKNPNNDIAICPDAVSNITIEILDSCGNDDDLNINFFYHVGISNTLKTSENEPIRIYLDKILLKNTFVLDYFTDSHPYLVCAVTKSHLSGIEFSHPIQYKITCNLHYFDFPKRLYLQTHRQVYPLLKSSKKQGENSTNLGSVQYENGNLYFLCTTDKLFVKPC